MLLSVDRLPVDSSVFYLALKGEPLSHPISNFLCRKPLSQYFPTMDSAVLSIFVLLQILLAPILYPMGYVVQGIVVLLSCWRKRSIKEDDLSLLEALAMTGLLCNMVLDENITMAGYAARFGLLLFRLYQSNRYSFFYLFSHV